MSLRTITMVISLLLASVAVAEYDIDWDVISAGGTDASSANYIMQGTVSQTAIGDGTSASYELENGYWNQFRSSSYLCGDADASSGVDIDDVVHLISYIFSGGPAPSPLEAGDADCSGGIDIDDVVYLIAYIFSGGPEPCASCE